MHDTHTQEGFMQFNLPARGYRAAAYLYININFNINCLKQVT